MRRRLLIVALWLAGTLGATAIVFIAVDRVSNNLFALTDPPADPKRTGTDATTTSATPAATSATTAPVEIVAPTSIEPTTTVATPVVTDAPDTEAPPAGTAETAPSTRTTTARQVGTGTTPNTTEPGIPTLAPPTVPNTTAAPPPPPTTEPPTDPPTAPATTRPASPCPQYAKAVARNAILYKVCSDGLHYANAVPVTGWRSQVTAYGPPTVSVTFTNGVQSLSCTLTADGDGIVTTSGDC